MLGFLQKCQCGNLIPKLNPGAVLLSVTIQIESLKEKQGLQSHLTKGITSGAIYLFIYFNSTPNKMPGPQAQPEKQRYYKLAK